MRRYFLNRFHYISIHGFQVTMALYEKFHDMSIISDSHFCLICTIVILF
ncbi:hypothetical protein CLOLEP_01161 [[Clostridium] leptum DSM 753]|uniref:Uncharacterized protein n=1 Tax=[Clostridium] leptum DSM 753 TaxID=428125 RepID=A7VRH8_9FIRM|nr:hypothetical protein CLOLEP_01161 [[Clostridium] leptum DSM 753]